MFSIIVNCWGDDDTMSCCFVLCGLEGRWGRASWTSRETPRRVRPRRAYGELASPLLASPSTPFRNQQLPIILLQIISLCILVPLYFLSFPSLTYFLYRDWKHRFAHPLVWLIAHNPFIFTKYDKIKANNNNTLSFKLQWSMWHLVVKGNLTICLFHLSSDRPYSFDQF